MYRRSVLEANPSLVTAIKKLLAEATTPVSIDYVAKNLKLNWSTTRGILLQLALEGKISARRTVRGWAFQPLRKEATA
jgi:predicted Rossmann fold nucleotide-binding protein DprA/Smf involved in DNA uptake